MSAVTTRRPETPAEPVAGDAAIIRRHALLAAGAGLVPVPVVDFAGTSAIALRMLRRLAARHGVDFFTEAARSAVTALAGGGAATLIAFGPARAAALAVPGVGLVAGMALGSASAGALVYAIGRVFALHFSLGGSFHDFDPERFREHFAEQLRVGMRRT